MKRSAKCWNDWKFPKQICILPVGDMVNEVLLEHEAPAFDDVQQCLLKGATVTLQPTIEYFGVFKLGHIFIEFLISVNLKKHKRP